MTDDDPVLARLRSAMNSGLAPRVPRQMREALHATAELAQPLDHVPADATVTVRITVDTADGRKGCALGWRPASGLPVAAARQALRDELFERFLDLVMPLPDRASD